MAATTRLTAQQIAEKSASLMWAQDAASRGLGMQLEQIAPGCATISMPIIASMANGHGNGQGGFIFTLADSAFAFACNSYNQRVVAQHCSITFIAPVEVGDHLTARAREISRQGRSGIYDVQVTNQHGNQIAEFRGHARSIAGTYF